MRRVLLVLWLIPAAAGAVELVRLDGSREKTERAVVKDEFVLVAFDLGLRRVPKAEIAMIVHDDGSRVTFERELGDAPAPAGLPALLQVSAEEWPMVRQKLVASGSRAVYGKVKELVTSESAEDRARAAEVLAGLGVEESVDAAVSLAIRDASADVRLRAGSALMGIAGLIDAHDWKAKLRPGLEHQDARTRGTIALVLGAAGDKAAIPVLRKDALHDRDHHVRESAAETLAGLGDDAGVDLLVKMLSRKSHPAGDRFLVAEKIRICGHLGKLRAKSALPALRRAAKSKEATVAAAAREAIAAIGGS